MLERTILGGCIRLFVREVEAILDLLIERADVFILNLFHFILLNKRGAVRGIQNPNVIVGCNLISQFLEMLFVPF